MIDNIKQIDFLIRSGSLSQARRLISSIAGKKVTRHYLLPLANLSRRANLPLIGIRLLNPIVRPNRKVATRATAAESAEYAASLIRIGSVDEALRILEGIKENEAPDSPLFSAFGHFAKWQYREAIPHLERYLSQNKLTDYQRLIGRVNLLAALVHEKKSQAESIGSFLLKDTKESKASLLYANTLELLSQYCILKERFFEAGEYLKTAESLIDEMETLDAFFIQKWKAVKGIYENPNSKTANQKLDSIEEDARMRGHFETIRDCERHRCLAKKDSTLALLLYSGTPNERFREDLLAEFKGKLDIPNLFVRNFLSGKELKQKLKLADESCFNITSGSLLSRSLLILLSDYYRPMRLATLYSELFPGEFYNPVSSPNRIHQILKRLRQELKAQKIPLMIKEANGSYYIEASQPVSVLLPVRSVAKNSKEPRISKLKAAFPLSEFSVHEAIKVLKLSQRSVSRLLLENTRTGALSKIGSTAKARYKFIF